LFQSNFYTMGLSKDVVMGVQTLSYGPLVTFNKVQFVLIYFVLANSNHSMKCSCLLHVLTQTSSSGGGFTFQIHLLWNPKVCYCAHKSLSLNPVLSQFNSVYTSSHPVSLRSIFILSSHLVLVSEMVSLLQVFLHIFFSLPCILHILPISPP